MIVVALFYDDYCPTCEDIMPHWQTFKRVYSGDAIFLEIRDDDETRMLFRNLGISWIPAVVFYVNNKEVKRLEGSFDLLDLERVMEKIIAKVRVLQVHQ